MVARRGYFLFQPKPRVAEGNAFGYPRFRLPSAYNGQMMGTSRTAIRKIKIVSGVPTFKKSRKW